jgi:hypothetical protein
VLLRVLEADSCESRQKWWHEVRACRRRRQVALDGASPIMTVFNTRSEFEFMEFKAIISRVQAGLQDKGMLVFDAFRVFNSSHSGLLTCSEFYGGLDYLGIPFTPQQIYDLVRKVAVQTEGLVSYEDFKRVFQSLDDEQESRTVGTVGDSNFEPVPPKMIPELVELNKPAGPDESVVITEELLLSFKVKAKPISAFTQIWNSQDTQSHAQVSVWLPSLQTSMLHSNKERVCLGLYACKGFNAPNKQRGATKYQLIEITDNATIRMRRARVMSAVIAAMCPYPIKYRQVWHFARGAKSLYAWQPIAPDNFIALGMYLTTSADMPDVKVMRCVPAIWCAPSKLTPVKVWDDAGGGGGKPASMWIINSMGMFVVTTGYDSPKDTYYELNSSRFFLDNLHAPAVTAVAGKG